MQRDVCVLSFADVSESTAARVSQLFGMQVIDARRLLRNTPAVLARNASVEQATALERELRALGAEVVVQASASAAAAGSSAAPPQAGAHQPAQPAAPQQPGAPPAQSAAPQQPAGPPAHSAPPRQGAGGSGIELGSVAPPAQPVAPQPAPGGSGIELGSVPPPGYAPSASGAPPGYAPSASGAPPGYAQSASGAPPAQGGSQAPRWEPPPGHASAPPVVPGLDAPPPGPPAALPPPPTQVGVSRRVMVLGGGALLLGGAYLWWRPTKIGGLSVAKLGTGGDGAPTLILLHGFGAPGDDLVPLGEEILEYEVAAGARVLVPEGITRVGLGKAWYNSRGDLAEARERLSDMLKELIEDGTLPERIMLAGFSQGGLMAMDIGLSFRPRIYGVAMLSGGRIRGTDWTEQLNAAETTRFLITHGRSDGVMPFRAAQDIANELEQAKAEVKLIPFKGRHRIPPAVREEVARFLGEMAGKV